MNPTTLSETLSELLAGVGAVSWRTGWLIVALVALRFVVRGRIPAQVWFAVWIVVALRLVLPFSVPLAWSPFNLMAEKSPARVDEPVVVGPAPKAMRAEVPRVATAQPATAAVKSQMATPMSGWTGREVLVATWLAGVALLGGLRWATASNFRRRLWMARPTVDERLLAQVEQEAAGGRARVTCRETGAVEAPALCGWFRPQLLFPVGLAAKLTDEELRFVVRHELGHWRRRDLWTQALMQVAVVVHWFNPLVWLAARLARTDCELACDEFVLRRERSGGASAYGAALLKVLGVVGERRSPLAVVGILENRRRLAERVRMIADYRTASVGRVVGGVVLVALVAVTSATREARAEEAKVGPKSPVVAATVSAPKETEEQARVRAEVRAKLDAARAAYLATYAVVNEQKVKVERLADQLYDYKKKNNLLSLDERAKLLEEQLGPAKFAVFRADKELAEAEAEQGRAVSTAKAEAQASVEAARARAESANSELRRLKAEQLAIDRARITLSKLERDLKLNTEILRNIATRARETSTLSERSVPQAMHAGPLVYLVGQVSRPGNYPLLEGAALSPAKLIASAGGFTATGDARLVRVTRFDPTTREAKVWVFDLERKDVDQAGAVFVLEAGDIVFVPSEV